MNEFKAGYASININPPLGIGIYGYYVPRFAKGFLDDLDNPYAFVVLVENGGYGSSVAGSVANTVLQSMVSR